MCPFSSITSFNSIAVLLFTIRHNTGGNGVIVGLLSRTGGVITRADAAAGSPLDTDGAIVSATGAVGEGAGSTRGSD